MTRTPRPEPTVAMLETYAPDGSVIARMEHHAAIPHLADQPAWALRLFPNQDRAIARLGGDVWVKDAHYATKAVTVDEAKAALDYATHVVLTYLEAVEAAQDTLTRGLDRACALAGQQTLPLED